MLMLPKDLKEAAMIERRRRSDEERKARIFNRRNLVIGIDKAALDQQISEKREREQEERLREAAVEGQRVRDAQLAMVLERRQAEERRLMEQEINNFRSVYQKKESRREFDLYDPDRLKKQLPGRLCDDDPRLGLASFQKFEGEDLFGVERSKYQHEQIRSWLEQQIEERRAADEARRAAEAAYDADLLDRDRRATELDLLEQDVRRKLNEATTDYNRALAAETDARRKDDGAREWEVNQAEIYNAQTGDMLSENPEAHKSALGCGRVVGFMYRGMTEAERRGVRDYQLRQVEEARARREEEKRRDAEWEKVLNGVAQHAHLKEREADRRQRQLNEELLEQNKKLAQEQTARQKYMNKVIFTNQPTAAYYEQFNATAR